VERYLSSSVVVGDTRRAVDALVGGGGGRGERGLLVHRILKLGPNIDNKWRNLLHSFLVQVLYGNYVDVMNFSDVCKMI
jgi:hypothetical protein